MILVQMYRTRTMSPGATTSGLILPSVVNPYELKSATVSMPVPPSVEMTRVSPDVEAPTARTFLPMAGLAMVHSERTVSPSLPAAKIKRFSGFYTGGYCGRKQREHQMRKVSVRQALAVRNII